MHKKLLLSALLLTAMFPVAVAQTNWSQNTACPGWNNPTAFTLGDANNYYSGQLGDRPNQAFDVMTGNTGMTWSTLLSRVQMNTTTVSSCTNSSSYGGVIPDNQKPFAIMTTTSQVQGSPVNRDPNTNGYLPLVPTQYNTMDTTPWFVNTNLTRSIRIGDGCANSGSDAGAAALYYNTRVTTENAIMYIYYAVVVQAPGHGKDVDPVFCIRATRQSPTGGWAQVSDTLAYYISSTPAPNQGITVSGNGGYGDVTLAPNYNTNGWHSNGGAGDNRVFYKDWSKVMLNLSDYMYENIRIEIMISDCAYNAHWAYAYVAGECRPMYISSQGCPAGMSTDVATLMAPLGMSHYQWSASNMGTSDPVTRLYPGGDDDWFTFRDLTNPLTEAQGGYIYNVQASDFKVNYRPNQSHALIQPMDSLGQVVDSFGNRQTFRCRMTSALDPDKPYSSDLYISVGNYKPTMQIDSLAFCDGNVRLWNRSYVPGNSSLVVDSNTMWWMYSDPACTGTPLDTLRGDSISYNFGDTNLHGFIVRSITTDPSCYSDAIYTIKPPSKYTSDTSATAAGHFLWHGTDYNASGDYPDTLTSHEGCDSIVTLHLTITTDTHAWVNMGDGLRWATCNVGATNPWDYGDYFAWGETSPKNTYSWENYIWGRGGSNITRYNNSDHITTLLPEDDAATANWGSDWRMPTREELTALCDTNKYSHVWITNYNGTGKKGLLVTRLTGPCAGNYIFFPAAGSRTNQNNYTNITGIYRSSSLTNIENAYNFSIDQTIGYHIYSNQRYIGYSVRAVMLAPTYTVAAASGNDTMGSAGVLVVTPGAPAATSEPSMNVGFGETVSLSATPNQDYHFVCWMEADTLYSRTADTVATILGNRSFTALFAPDMADIVLTNLTCGMVGNKLKIEYQYANQGEVDYTTTVGITVYRNHYRGEVVGGAPLMYSDDDMLASSGNVETRSYLYGRMIICRLEPEDSLVVAINDMGLGVARHANAQPESDTLNNIAVLHINGVFPDRHVYSVDEQAVCDSLTWIDDSTYRASTDTAYYTAVSNYQGSRCDSVIRLDLTVSHSTASDTVAVACDSMQWHGQTYTANAEPALLLQAANADGCDSTVTLHLTVNHSSTSNTTVHAVNHYTWNGTEYTTGGDIQDSLYTAEGCDSLATLHLTLDYIDTITLAVNDTNMGSITLLGTFMSTDTVDLSTIHGDYTVQDGTVLTGTLGGNYKISVVAGASIMLSNMNITGVHDSSYMWAGLSLLGDATIVLDDSTTNYIKGFFFKYPGIHVPAGATLTIRGNGELTAHSGRNGSLLYAAGIGGGYDVPSGSIVIESGIITTIGGYGASLGGGYNTQRRACGNIAIHGGTISATCIGGGYNALIDSVLITGGTITARASANQPGIGCDGSGILNHIIITGGTINATGGSNGAGIGGGRTTTVNNITITGGTITAKGGNLAAGIGSGSYNGHCGEIVIASSVTSVTAIKGNGSTQNIGSGDNGTCDTVIVSGQPYTDDPYASSYTFVGDGSSDNVQRHITAVTPLPDGRYTVLRGTQVVAKATPKANHHLASWSDGTAVNASGTDTISTNGSVTITAFFEHDPYIVNVAVLDTNSGNAMVIYNDSVATSLPVGTDTNAVVAISATAKYGYHFDRWEEVDTMYNFNLYSHTADTSVRVTGDRWFYAYFEPNIYTISTHTADTTMGTAAVDNNMQGPVAANQPSVQAEYNSWLMLTATPKRGYHFVQWEEADSVYSHTADTFVVANADRSFTAVFSQDSHSFVEMGDGLRWATNNIGADNPWDAGDYFAWGETEPKNSYSWSTYRFSANGSNTDFTRYTGSDYDTLLAEDDAATANWGRGWRMATRDEWQTLMNTNNYSWQWTNNYNNTGNRGYTVTRLTGPCAGNTIFLPANGYKDNYWLNNRQSCRYWSSTIASDNINAWKTTMDNSNFSMYEAARYLGGAVRAVGHTSMISVAAQSDDTTMGTAGLMVATPGATAAAVLEQRVTVDTGASVTLSAMPKIGYIFVRWMEADTTYSLSADTVITVMGERSLKAFFAVHPVDTLILAVNDTSMGSIAIEGAFTPTDTVDLATLTGDYTVQDGTVLTGTLTNDYKISVAAGASVLLKGIIIPGISTAEHPWAGLSLLGDATLFLDDSSYVKGYHYQYPGIHVPAGSTLTIRGEGILTAQPCSRAAAIGGGYQIDNGNIVIESGTIHAHGYYAAGIGGGYRAQSCGNITIHGGNIDASSIGGGDSETIDSITITGGTVIATGNDFEAGVGTGHTGTVNHIIITGGTVIAQGGTRAAGIGGGIFAHCGEIVIDSTVTLVTSSKGHLTDTNIGTGFQGTFDTIIVGGQGYTDVSNPFSYSGNGSGNQFEPTTVIDLGGDRYKVLRGRQVVVQATAKPGHHLASWSDGAAVNADGTDTLTVNGSMTLTAIFEHDAYLISATATDTAMGSAVVIYDDTVAATLPVLPDSTFILEATANPCHHFVCWTKGGDTVASESIIELQATDTSFYMAHFERNLPLLGDTTAVVCDSLVWFGTAYTATDTATHKLLTAEGCDSTVTLHLTVKYSSTGDTTAEVCDLFMWYDSIYTATSTPTHRFTNAVGCDSTVTLNLTVNYKNTGDTVAVVCDSFAWYGDTYTVSNDSLTHFMEAANQWGCDSTVILHLTVNYQNTGDTTAVECDQFSWYEHQGLTASTDTLTHLLANRWGCDSTVTLHLTVNYQNTGDTTAVECDQFTWYEHTRVTASTDTLTHLFVGGNQWGCDSTVTLHLTVNYQNTGDTAAVKCDQFSWYEHQNITASDSTRTHLFAGANQWGCDSTVTLHLTVNYQNTGDTTAVECDQYSWYEHQNMTASDSTRTHLFAGANQWGCDSTVTLHLTVNYSNTGDTAAVVCDSLVWYDSTYTLTAAPTHVFANQWGCDSTVTLSLTVNYSSTSDTTAVECDQFAWNGTTYTASGEPERHYTNAVGCDSTRTLHLTINYQNTGDTTAVECDQFSWYEHQNLTTSSNNLTHLFQGANQWGCDSTVTLNLTVNYKNTGDTTIVACDQYSWYEHTGLSASVDTLKHLFVGGNRWGCDSTTTLHLTVNYQNTGDTTAVECDHFTWYQHHNLSTSSDNRTHRFVGANQWGCDSTVTLHLTVNYSNTGDTTAVECDLFSWYEHQNLTSSSNNKTHRLVGANQWGCDSTVTLHLTVNYQNTGDTSAVTYEPFTWYEHTNMGSTQNVQHTFAGSNRWGCDSTVTLHLRYALFTTSWSGATTVTYNSQPQNVISATYVDDTGRVQQAALTFTNGTEVISTPNYPVGAGVWAVVARPMLPVDSLSAATTTLTILPATVSVSGAVVRTAKVIDGTTTAEVIDPGVLNNIQGSDPLTHTTTAEFSDATVGQDKTITLTYTLHGDADLLSNYTLQRTTEVYSTLGAIVDPIEPDPQHTFDLAEYGYCTGSGAIGYHLSAGSPDQYKIDFADSRIADVDWTNLATTEPDGTISIDIPEGLPMGDYSMSVTFRNSSYTWIESAPMALTIHVNLPASYTKPLFYNVIILIDTCECITDVQWYHREVGGEWAAIPGANDYNYRQVAGLTGEYFAKVKMNGVETYTCPQSDLVTLVRDEHPAAPTISAHPNPTTNTVTVGLTDPSSGSHLLRVINTTGVEMERRTFDGNTTTIEMSQWQSGSYIVSVDGLIVRVIKK